MDTFCLFNHQCSFTLSKISIWGWIIVSHDFLNMGLLPLILPNPVVILLLSLAVSFLGIVQSHNSFSIRCWDSSSRFLELSRVPLALGQGTVLRTLPIVSQVSLCSRSPVLQVWTQKNTKNNTSSLFVKPSLVKLETSCTEILPPTVYVLCSNPYSLRKWIFVIWLILPFV